MGDAKITKINLAAAVIFAVISFFVVLAAWNGAQLTTTPPRNQELCHSYASELTSHGISIINGTVPIPNFGGGHFTGINSTSDMIALANSTQTKTVILSTYYGTPITLLTSGVGSAVFFALQTPATTYILACAEN